MRVLGSSKSNPNLKLARNAVLLAVLCGAAAVSLEAAFRAHLTDSLLSAPTRFYARPMLLQPGMTLDRDRLEGALKRLGYEKTSRNEVAVGEYKTGRRQWIVGRRAFRIYDQLDPGGRFTIRLGYGNRISTIRASDGTRVQTLALEPELISSVYVSGHEDRIPINLDDAPEHLVDAILAIEDQRYFQHDGLDARRVVGAAIANVQAGRIVQGASTITQQLAKNLFLSPKQTLIRKVRELAIARTLEMRYSKEEILEAYLNEVYLGQMGARAIHGVGRGAQFFFGKDVSQLSVGESALLAGIIRGPSLYSPFRHPDAARGRRDLVLNRLLELDKISEEEHRVARASPLYLRTKPLRARSGRYFVDFTIGQLAESERPRSGPRGLSVFTTLDMQLQTAAEEAVTNGLAELERYYPRLARENKPLQAALVALDPQTGEVLAMVGGRDYGASQFNRASRALRQPGSSFKPVVALAALSARNGGSDGNQPHFTLASVLEDRPFSVETKAGTWTPDNYDGRFRGQVTLREAIEESLNVPFARLGMAIGADNIVETAEALGIENPLNAVPSLALGSSEVTPLELTQAYGVLAAAGYRANVNSIVAVLARDGSLLHRAEPTGEQVFDAAEVFLVTSALRGAVERGTGSSLRTLGFRGPVAAKSGTTNNFRDAWFIGYTPSLAVGVWVGFDDGHSIGLSGSRAALPIFGQFLVSAQGVHGDSEFAVPNGLEVATANRNDGLLGRLVCRGEPEVFLRGTAPENSCSPYWGFTSRFRSGVATRQSTRLASVIRELQRRLSRGTN